MNPNTLSAIAFLTGSSMDSEGRYINEYAQFTPDKWEECHNHIQWAFPSSIPSIFNPNAPVIDWDELKRILGDYDAPVYPSALHNLQTMYYNYFGSIGMTYDADDNVVISQDHPQQLAWLEDSNDHNHRRITRVMMLWHHVGHYYMNNDPEFHAFVNAAILAITIAFVQSNAFSADTYSFWQSASIYGTSPTREFMESNRVMDTIIPKLMGKGNV